MPNSGGGAEACFFTIFCIAFVIRRVPPKVSRSGANRRESAAHCVVWAGSLEVLQIFDSIRQDRITSKKDEVRGGMQSAMTTGQTYCAKKNHETKNENEAKLDRDK